MTEQYQVEDINGQPSPLSLRANPSATAVPGLVDTEAFFWPTLAADAVIVGEGLVVAGDANQGTIIQVGQPGLYEISFVSTAPLAVVYNILRGAAGPIVAPFYPALDFASGIPLGAMMVGFTGAPPPLNTQYSVQFRITGTDLVDPVGGVNPNRQVRFSAAAADIPSLIHLGTLIEINRVSM